MYLQMNASNLAVCFAPSLFHLSGPRTNQAASPKRSRKNLGIPDQKELLEQKAAHECLTHMILDCKKLFMVSYKSTESYQMLEMLYACNYISCLICLLSFYAIFFQLQCALS